MKLRIPPILSPFQTPVSFQTADFSCLFPSGCAFGILCMLLYGSTRAARRDAQSGLSLGRRDHPRMDFRGMRSTPLSSAPSSLTFKPMPLAVVLTFGCTRAQEARHAWDSIRATHRYKHRWLSLRRPRRDAQSGLLLGRRDHPQMASEGGAARRSPSLRLPLLRSFPYAYTARGAVHTRPVST